MIDRMCSDHKARTLRPRLCNVCQRLAVEQDIVTKLVDALLKAGYVLRVNDGEDSYPEATQDRATVLEQLGEVDDEHIEVGTPVTSGKPKRVGWIRLVYGNDGYDVISDYTTNLEEVLKPINDYADTLA